jgi:hypothetical protein
MAALTKTTIILKQVADHFGVVDLNIAANLPPHVLSRLGKTKTTAEMAAAVRFLEVPDSSSLTI